MRSGNFSGLALASSLMAPMRNAAQLPNGSHRCGQEITNSGERETSSCLSNRAFAISLAEFQLSLSLSLTHDQRDRAAAAVSARRVLDGAQMVVSAET